MSTLTLTDFLLARIAEDEAPTYELVPYACEPECCAPEGWVGHRCLICDTPAEFGGTVEAITEISREHEEGVHRRSRTLAECVAKRQIVEMVDDSDSPEIHVDAWVLASAAVRDLAAVYAEHPDYREEWRP